MYREVIKLDKHLTDFKTLRDYHIYAIKQFGSCGVANWYKNLDNLDDDTLRIIFVLLMSDNRKNIELNNNYKYINKLENDIEMLKYSFNILDKELADEL